MIDMEDPSEYDLSGGAFTLESRLSRLEERVTYLEGAVRVLEAEFVRQEYGFRDLEEKSLEDYARRIAEVDKKIAELSLEKEFLLETVSILRQDGLDELVRLTREYGGYEDL